MQIVHTKAQVVNGSQTSSQAVALDTSATPDMSGHVTTQHVFCW